MILFFQGTSMKVGRNPSRKRFRTHPVACRESGGQFCTSPYIWKSEYLAPSSLMFVAMMHIGNVCMGMGDLLMPMRVTVGLAGRIVFLVLMLMVHVMSMKVVVV